MTSAEKPDVSNSTAPGDRCFWIKLAVCSVWIGLAVLPRIVDLNQFQMPTRLHGALLLVSGLIEVSSPIALIWLFVLWREAT